MKITEHKHGKTEVAKAELRPDRQLSGLACDLNERLEVSRNMRRRKLVSPFLIAGGIEFPLFDNPVDKKAGNRINQQHNDAQLRTRRFIRRIMKCLSM
jgi:hypothetical protein